MAGSPGGPYRPPFLGQTPEIVDPEREFRDQAREWLALAPGNARRAPGFLTTRRLGRKGLIAFLAVFAFATVVTLVVLNHQNQQNSNDLYQLNDPVVPAHLSKAEAIRLTMRQFRPVGWKRYLHYPLTAQYGSLLVIREHIETVPAAWRIEADVDPTTLPKNKLRRTPRTSSGQIATHYMAILDDRSKLVTDTLWY
jgi:hypothetical protein